MVPTERQRHSVQEHGGLARLRATERELALAAGVLADEDKWQIAQCVVERRGWRNVK